MISKQGWINLYKPKNITSFKAINSIKKKFSINKIGHAGTLDPMAEGVLPIAIGKATKLIPYINIMKKEYSPVFSTITPCSDKYLVTTDAGIPSSLNSPDKFNPGVTIVAFIGSSILKLIFKYIIPKCIIKNMIKLLN